MIHSKQERRLRLLTITTIVVLAGIILLQVYWLVTSYQQQKSRFKADIENALTATSVKTALHDIFSNVHNELLDATNMTSLTKNTRVTRIAKEDIPGKASGYVAFEIPSNDIRIVDTQKLLSALKKMVDSNKLFNPTDTIVIPMSQGIDSIPLEKYRLAYSKELAERSIHTPFEMAVIDSNGHIYKATCDTELFKKIPVKSSSDHTAGRMAQTTAGLQVAFPDANIYLLQRLLWVIVLTVVLIIIGTTSLTYLLSIFFRQKKISDIRTDFMNNMTHELKTPISSVGVALEMVLDEKHIMTEIKKKAYLTIAQSELKRLNMLVENVLKIVSLERSEIRINKEPIVIAPWLENIKNTFEPMLESRQGSMMLEINPHWLVFSGDKTHITNVIQNLVENALKYNDKADPKISITAWQTEETVLIQVRDNGPGIPSKYIDKVFDKFFRVPKGDRHDVKGYGLGLSYVKTIIELHDGNIILSSVPGDGCTFTIYLPLLKAN